MTSADFSSYSQDGGLQAPPGYVTPKFPGLYTPTFDLDAQNVTAVEGKFLFYAEGEAAPRRNLKRWCTIDFSSHFSLQTYGISLCTGLS